MIGRLRTVVLDAADMDAEARFWSALLDVPVVHRSDDWTTLEGRGVRLAVQLDVEVEDVDRAEQQVLALGARRLPDPPDAEDFRVYADPAGHPFCLVFTT